MEDPPLTVYVYMSYHITTLLQSDVDDNYCVFVLYFYRQKKISVCVSGQ